MTGRAWGLTGASLLLCGCPPEAVDKPEPETVVEDSGPAPPMDADGDGAPLPEDCDDADPAVHPGAVEVCNDRDDDCDGGVDEDLAVVTWYTDADLDGYGVPEPTREACGSAPGWSDRADDCDDGDAAVHPDARDAPHDTLDADCDGVDPCATEDHRWYKGDLRFTDAFATVDMEEFCKSYDAVDGGVSFEGDNIFSLDAYSCIVCVSDFFWVEAPRLRSIDALNLVWVGGDLAFLESSLQDLWGLSSLRGIDGTLYIWDTEVEDLSPLANLASLGSLELVELPASDLGVFRWVESLEYVYISSGTVSDLTGLSSLASVGELVLGGGPMTLDGLEGLAHADGITLYGLPNVTDLEALAGAGPATLLYVVTSGLRTLEGLNVAPVGEYIEIERTTTLESLRGLEAIEAVTRTLSIWDNADLQSLEGLDGLREANTVLIEDNPLLVDLTGLDALEYVGANIWIENLDSLTSLTGLGSLREAEWLAVYDNPALVSLDGLEGLRTVTSKLTITSNPSLESVQALHGLESVEDLTIVGNPRLSTAETDALIEAIGLENIHGELDVRDNGG